VERGPVEAFGDYEEFRENGEVKSLQEFKKLWKEYYPEETYWYEFGTSKYQDGCSGSSRFSSISASLSHVFRSSLFCAKPGTKTILNRAMVLIYLLVLPLINIKNVNKSRK
jgi:hypothetical protein